MTLNSLSQSTDEQVNTIFVTISYKSTLVITLPKAEVGMSYELSNVITKVRTKNRPLRWGMMDLSKPCTRSARVEILPASVSRFICAGQCLSSNAYDWRVFTSMGFKLSRIGATAGSTATTAKVSQTGSGEAEDCNVCAHRFRFSPY